LRAQLGGAPGEPASRYGIGASASLYAVYFVTDHSGEYHLLHRMSDDQDVLHVAHVELTYNAQAEGELLVIRYLVLDERFTQLDAERLLKEVFLPQVVAPELKQRACGIEFVDAKTGRASYDFG